MKLIVTYLLTAAVQVMWNISDKSASFCERIIKVGLHADMFGYLKSDVLCAARLRGGKLTELKKILVQGQLGTLHNVVQKAQSAREHFRQCAAVDILQPFREETSPKLQVRRVISSDNLFCHLTEHCSVHHSCSCYP